MRYFHRTSLQPDDVLAEADGYFRTVLSESRRTDRSRGFEGSLGQLNLTVGAEGGHYVRITAETDQMGESELDKMVKRFLAVVHARVDVSHEVRGAY